MTTFCPKCNSPEYESCLNMFELQTQCRKCLLNNPFYYGTFSCDCGEWGEEGLKKMIDEGCMIPKCQVCLKIINTDVTRISNEKYLANKGCPENQQRFENELSEVITLYFIFLTEKNAVHSANYNNHLRNFKEKWGPK